jgi:hypothetical protein
LALLQNNLRDGQALASWRAGAAAGAGSGGTGGG